MSSKENLMSEMLIHDNISRLTALTKKYEFEVPFEHFYHTKQCGFSRVTKNIDDFIISILRDVIDNYLDLDIAFVRIHKLIIYVTDNIDTLYPHSSLHHYRAYYKFFIHFLVFGCCLGTNYSQYIVLNSSDPDYKQSDLLQYCLNEFIPSISPKHIKYKQCNNRRSAMICAVKEFIDVEDITELIADYVNFKFSEFFVTLSVYFKSFDESQVPSSKLLRRLMLSYNFNPQMYFIPKLLSSKQFISINDNEILKGNLEYFADTVFEKSLKCKKTTFFETASFWSWFVILTGNFYLFAVGIIVVVGVFRAFSDVFD